MAFCSACLTSDWCHFVFKQAVIFCVCCGNLCVLFSRVLSVFFVSVIFHIFKDHLTFSKDIFDVLRELSEFSTYIIFFFFNFSLLQILFTQITVLLPFVEANSVDVR
jgi:hypothetical protein